MAAPELARDPDLVDRLLSVMTAKNPAVARFMPLPRDSEGRLDRPSLANAIAHGFCVVQWHLDPEPSAAP